MATKSNFRGNSVSRLGETCIHIVVGGFALACVIPFIFIIIIAFSSAESLRTVGYSFFPIEWSTASFQAAFDMGDQLAVILSEGVEGIHWEYDADGLIVLNADARADYAPWRFGMGNIFVLTPRDTDGIGYFERFNEYNARGVPTGILGFTFDNTPVGLEMAALTGVVEQFHQSLTVGAIDPATAVPDYLALLQANGIDTVLEELNRQLQEFFANR